MQEKNLLSFTIRVTKDTSDTLLDESGAGLALKMVDKIKKVHPNAQIHVEVEI